MGLKAMNDHSTFEQLGDALEEASGAEQLYFSKKTMQLILEMLEDK